MTTEDERRAAIRARPATTCSTLHADDVLIDLLTDSGTGAMSPRPVGRDPARRRELRRLAVVVRVPRGASRSCSRSATSSRPTRAGRPRRSCSARSAGPGKVVPNNTHFDTTRANVEFTGAEAVDLVIAGGPRAGARSTRSRATWTSRRSSALLAERGRATSRSCSSRSPTTRGGGQPVSLENLRGGPGGLRPARRAAVPRRLPVRRERLVHPASASRARPTATVPDIVREMASLADGMTMSAKKDGLANIGGWLAMNDDALAERCRNLLILTEGFPTYGGLAGRDLEAIAQGLREVVERGLPALPDPLDRVPRRRARSGRRAGRPAVRRPRGVPRRAGAAARTSRRSQYPGQALAVALYVAGGIRGCEIGTVMFGRHPDGTETPAPMDLVRLAIPRRTYTQSHIDYVDRGRARRSPRAAASCAATGSSPSRPRCATSRRPSRRSTADDAEPRTVRPRLTVEAPTGAGALIAALGMTPHPEGGHYVETWRDAPADGARGRAARSSSSSSPRALALAPDRRRRGLAPLRRRTARAEDLARRADGHASSARRRRPRRRPPAGRRPGQRLAVGPQPRRVDLGRLHRRAGVRVRRLRAGARRLGAGPMTVPSALERAEIETRLSRPAHYELVRTLSPLRHGHGDPTIRLATGSARRAARTPDGPATIEVVDTGEALVVRGWGPGAGWSVERAADLCGLNDDPGRLLELRPPHRLVADLARRFAGVRIPRSNRVVEALVPAILEQKITGEEARRIYRALVSRYGEPAPGPFGLRLQPTPERLASLPYSRVPPARSGAPPRRDAPPGRRPGRPPGARRCRSRSRDAHRLLGSVVGVGPWTVNEVGPRRARGPGRGQRRRLPPAEHGRLRAGRRAARGRRPDARAARAVPRAAWPGRAAARDERPIGATPWAADAGPVDRGVVTGQRTRAITVRRPGSTMGSSRAGRRRSARGPRRAPPGACRPTT